MAKDTITVGELRKLLADVPDDRPFVLFTMWEEDDVQSFGITAEMVGDPGWRFGDDREQVVRRKLDRQREAVQKLRGRSTELATLRRDIERTLTMYDSVVSRYQRVELSDTSPPLKIAVLDRATPSTQPVPQKRHGAFDQVSSVWSRWVMTLAAWLGVAMPAAAAAAATAWALM